MVSCRPASPSMLGIKEETIGKGVSTVRHDRPRRRIAKAADAHHLARFRLTGLISQRLSQLFAVFVFGTLGDSTFAVKRCAPPKVCPGPMVRNPGARSMPSSLCESLGYIECFENFIPSGPLGRLHTRRG